MKLLKDFELLSFTQGWSCDFPGTKEEGLSHSWREWKDPTISGENCSQSKLFQNFLSEWEDSELSTAANVIVSELQAEQRSLKEQSLL